MCSDFKKCSKCGSEKFVTKEKTEVCSECLSSYFDYIEKVRIENKEDVAKWILPFGKYKGDAIGDVYLEDRGYVVWLSNQEWLQDGFRDIVEKILD